MLEIWEGGVRLGLIFMIAICSLVIVLGMLKFCRRVLLTTFAWVPFGSEV